MFIAIDFDGTIVEHEYPEIGEPVPGAIEWMKKLQEAGAQLILWTMRSGLTLDHAVNYLTSKGITLYGINENPSQSSWTQSRKAYAHVYIDDAAFGCPLLSSKRPGARPFVNWEVVGPALLAVMRIQ